MSFLCYIPHFLCRALIGGGGAPEIHVSRLLSQHASSLKGMEAYCFQAYADALEIIPTTLAENAGMNPIAIVTELRNRHALGERNAGINVRTVSVDKHDLSLTHNLTRVSFQIYWKRMLCNHFWSAPVLSSCRLKPFACCSRSMITYKLDNIIFVLHRQIEINSLRTTVYIFVC